MTFKTRQEVLRAAADWMDVCAENKVHLARYKYRGELSPCTFSSFIGETEDYEFPIALLEGKEVWVGSELYFHTGLKDTVTAWSEEDEQFEMAGGWYFSPKLCSWNPPKPKTVMVELLMDDVKFIGDAYETFYGDRSHLERAARACKKALEELK